MSAELDLREFKKFIYTELESHPILRDMPDKISVREFLDKVPSWLELLKKEENRG